MLSLENRLKKRKSFAYIHKNGRRSHAGILSLSVVGANVRDVKIGFSVSKKIGNSVVRHTVTRRMRVAAREVLPQIKPKQTIIFTAREGIEGVHLNDIRKAMLLSLKKAGLLKDGGA